MPWNSSTIIGLCVGFLVVGVLMVYVGGQLGDTIAGMPTLNGTGIIQPDTIQPVIVGIGMTISKVIIITSLTGIVFGLLQKVGLLPSLSDTRAYSQPRVERPEPVRVMGEIEERAVQPGADQLPDAGEREEEKKPEKRDRYEVVKV